MSHLLQKFRLLQDPWKFYIFHYWWHRMLRLSFFFYMECHLTIYKCQLSLAIIINSFSKLNIKEHTYYFQPASLLFLSAPFDGCCNIVNICFMILPFKWHNFEKIFTWFFPFDRHGECFKSAALFNRQDVKYQLVIRDGCKCYIWT